MGRRVVFVPRIEKETNIAFQCFWEGELNRETKEEQYPCHPYLSPLRVALQDMWGKQADRMIVYVK